MIKLFLGSCQMDRLRVSRPRSGRETIARGAADPPGSPSGGAAMKDARGNASTLTTAKAREDAVLRQRRTCEGRRFVL